MNSLLLTTKITPEPIKVWKYPDTRYMGSKRKLLPMISDVLDTLNIDTALDAFSGSGCVSYLMKQKGYATTANDFLKFTSQFAHASIQNNTELLGEDEVMRLLQPNPLAKDFVSTKYKGLYFSDEDNAFLDNLWANIELLKNPAKRSLALAAAHRACMKRRPRGIFTYTGNRYQDGRADLRMNLSEHFVKAVQEWNDSVFDNGRANHALNYDVFDIPMDASYDLVYIDPPYLSPMSDNDYTRRYHFVEGYASYWQSDEIQEHTLTKKIKSKPSAFSSKSTIFEAFDRLFEKFKDSTLLVSYSSNSIPSKEDMVDLLKKYKQDVTVYEYDYKYSFGTHNHILGNTNNKVSEYLFLAK